MLVKGALTLFVSLVFAACSATEPAVDNRTQPTWVLDPNLSGAVGAVGQCGTHYDGRSMQRKVAITRAIDELAMQGDVTVDSEIYVSTEVLGSQVKNRSKSKTYVSAKGVPVHAFIEEMWFDKKSEVLYVWMIKD
ncbi:MAG: hypothetical protein WBF77_03400 [Sulfurimonadaceae bacterium]